MKINFEYVLLLFLIFSFTQIYPKNYYVDYQNGNNSFNGLTVQTAWKHCPGDPSASGMSASTTLMPGDTVFFKGGVSYLGQITINGNGTSSNPIVFIGSSSWGIDRATFDMQNTRQYAFRGSGDYVKIQGFNFYNYYDLGTDYVIYPSTGASNWTIDNCAFGFVQGWKSIPPPDKPAIYLSNSISNIIIKNCEFVANGRTTIRIRAASYITIQDNNFGGINRGDSTGYWSVGIRFETTANHLYIRDNVFHHDWTYGGDVNPELFHSPADIHGYGSNSTSHPDEIYIERNNFYSDHNFNTGSGSAQIELETYVSHFYIRNNLAMNGCQYYGSLILLAEGVNNGYIENNTFVLRPYKIPYAVNAIKVYLNSSPVGDNIFIRNNIFWTDGSGSGDAYSGIFFNGTATFTGVIDYNAYYSPSNTKVNIYSSSIVGWTAWQGHGLDVHSHWYDTDIEPSFLTIPANGLTTSSGNYRLSNSAPPFLKTGGLPLTEFVDDKDNNIRNSNSWTIGAYQYSDGGTTVDNTPPTLLTASVINPTTIELGFSEALESISALNKLNYVINNGIIVNSASLSSDSKKVTLTTTQNAANQTYTVVVSNIKDLAGNIISSSNNSAQYSYVGDTTSPNLLNAAVINSTAIALLFSEPLETTSAQTKTNYTINNGIVVNSASLSVDKKSVTLNTTQHTANQIYTVTVSNVKDLAGNIISTNNSAQYSFVDNTVGDLKANVKIYLQGPFVTSNMMTELSGNEFLPSSQPYNVSPWFYNGSESSGSSSSTTVDWVIVELRSAQNPAQVISRRACLLRNDGIIIEPNGTTGVTFKNLLYGSYYIAVFHRNHLAVMTAVPVSFSPDNSLYDFTNALTKAYGQSAMTEITTGIFGMYAGDGDGNGTINESDRSEIWSNQNGTMGYLDGDFNLDSGVTVKDINDYWNFNEGKVMQVP